ncbi:hypothetical protein ACH5RR_039527 [Cinchona calisaya]|uniref:RNase H type-1 domain-containing protein n=1 Tax=Cinchona calisaya TaxID=153742 RepID=A0ABD2Y3U6_9GENT
MGSSHYRGDKDNIDLNRNVVANRTGIGIVGDSTTLGIDCDKQIEVIWARKEISKDYEELEAAEAIKMALFRLWIRNGTTFKGRADNKEIIKRLQHKDIIHPILANLLEDYLALSSLFQLCSFSLVSSHNNSLCFKVANFAKDLVKDVMWENFFPIWVANLANNL